MDVSEVCDEVIVILFFCIPYLFKRTKYRWNRYKYEMEEKILRNKISVFRCGLNIQDCQGSKPIEFFEETNTSIVQPSRCNIRCAYAQAKVRVFILFRQNSIMV